MNDTGFTLDSQSASHVWVIPFWMKGNASLKVLINGSSAMHLALNSDSSCRLISADDEVNDQDREEILSRINQLLIEDENAESTAADTVVTLKEAATSIK